ncbi:hypothetical protein EZ428_21775 [Pedobacter frigiditerrae]|uniref:Uncharacterized protein n=1 Tax=Pedobacter frigiditerrae TaxID=2530452 RepID=A0A4R0ML18_9SPHI|nr:hypothetical protein [Pedobacter frigiditerrae]TCC87331.1 hypothetical protein EZ428_21775 [Pedobacter frigiditerrae]
MSNVTNLILSFSLSENEQEILEELEKFSYNQNEFEIVSVNDDKLPNAWYGGTKNLETNLFIGAYNHFESEKFIDFLRKISWKEMGEVQVIIKGQFDDRFRVENIFSI